MDLYHLEGMNRVKEEVNEQRAGNALCAEVKDSSKREVAFSLVPSNLGKKGKECSYSARLTHNQVLDEDAVISDAHDGVTLGTVAVDSSQSLRGVNAREPRAYFWRQRVQNRYALALPTRLTVPR